MRNLYPAPCLNIETPKNSVSNSLFGLIVLVRGLDVVTSIVFIFILITRLLSGKILFSYCSPTGPVVGPTGP